MEKKYLITSLQNVIEIGLNMGHSAHLLIDKGKAALIGTHEQKIQKVFERAAHGELYVYIRIITCRRIGVAITRKLTIQTNSDRNRVHLSTSNRGKHPDYIAIFERRVAFLDNVVNENDVGLFRGDP
jgi:hypothetical protein